MIWGGLFKRSKAPSANLPFQSGELYANCMFPRQPCNNPYAAISPVPSKEYSFGRHVFHSLMFIGLPNTRSHDLAITRLAMPCSSGFREPFTDLIMGRL